MPNRIARSIRSKVVPTTTSRDAGDASPRDAACSRRSVCRNGCRRVCHLDRRADGIRSSRLRCCLVPEPEGSTPRRRRRSLFRPSAAMISQTWMFRSRHKSPRARHRCGLERFYGFEGLQTLSESRCRTRIPAHEERLLAGRFVPDASNEKPRSFLRGLSDWRRGRVREAPSSKGERILQEPARAPIIHRCSASTLP